MDVLQQWGIELTRAMQAAIPWADRPMRLASDLGQEGFFQMLIPLLYWCVDARLGARVALLVLASNQVNAWAKWVFHQPRPCWLAPEVGHDIETSYGIPSGHAQNAMTLWPYFAWVSGRRWAWPAAGAVVILVSLSRIYLGVHFPHDVLMGWLLGLTCLGAFLRWGSRFEEWLASCAGRRLVLFAVALAAGLAAVSAGLLWAIRGVVDPPVWAGAAQGARSFAGALGMAGMLSGAVLGYGLQESTVGFDAGGPPAKRVVRFLVGLVGLVAILAGLPALFRPDAGSLLEGPWRFARYFAAMLWATWGAPWLFVAAGLARRRTAKVA